MVPTLPQMLLAPGTLVLEETFLVRIADLVLTLVISLATIIGGALRLGSRKSLLLLVP